VEEKERKEKNHKKIFYYVLSTDLCLLPIKKIRKTIIKQLKINIYNYDRKKFFFLTVKKTFFGPQKRRKQQKKVKEKVDDGSASDCHTKFNNSYYRP